MGKSDANECNESSLSNCRVQLALSTKKDGMILEHPSLRVRKDGQVFEKITSIFLGKPLSFNTRKDFQSPSAPHVTYPSRKDQRVPQECANRYRENHPVSRYHHQAISLNSRSLKLSKKQPRASLNRRGSMMSTPSISVFITFIISIIVKSGY